MDVKDQIKAWPPSAKLEKFIADCGDQVHSEPTHGKNRAAPSNLRDAVTISIFACSHLCTLAGAQWFRVMQRR